MVRIAFVDNAMPPSSSPAASSNDAPIGRMAQRLLAARTMRHAAVAQQQSAYKAPKANEREFEFGFGDEAEQEEAAHVALGGGGGGAGGGGGGGVNPIAKPAKCAEQMVRIARFRRRGARSRARCSFAHARHAPPLLVTSARALLPSPFARRAFYRAFA